MSQGCGLDLKDVVCHVPGRDTSLRRMYASHGVPMEASTDSRSEKFAIAIAQCQRAKCVRRSDDPSMVINIRGFRGKDSPALSEVFWNGSSFQQILVSIKKEPGAQSSRTSVSAIWNSIGARCRIFLHGNELVKSPYQLFSSPPHALQGFTNVKTLRIHPGNGSLRVGLSTTAFDIFASILPNIESQLLILLYSTSDVSLLRWFTSNFAKMTLEVILSQMRLLLTSV